MSVNKHDRLAVSRMVSDIEYPHWSGEQNGVLFIENPPKENSLVVMPIDWRDYGFQTHRLNFRQCTNFFTEIGQ